MRPPERFRPDDPRDWLNRARSNLVRARTQATGAYLEDLCFDAQQAAQKAIEAVMTKRRIDFPYIQDIARLPGMLEAGGQVIPQSVERVANLTPYATVLRYPGIERSVSAEAHAEAVGIAEAVLRWAEEQV